MNKWIRKFYEDDGRNAGSYTFTYCNWTSWRNTVSLVIMLYEEILSDFPNINPDNVLVLKRTKMPYEVALSFIVSKEEINIIDLSKFEEIPKDFYN